jgi:hypothetical protein
VLSTVGWLPWRTAAQARCNKPPNDQKEESGSCASLLSSSWKKGAGQILTDGGESMAACYRQKLTWSIWAKKWAAIKMGFEDNHGWSSESAPARVFLGQIGPYIFIVIRVQFS